MKRGFTLLLAEDDEDDIVFFRQALEEAAVKATIPVRLEVTPNGEEAIRYLKGEGEFSDRAKYPFPQIIVTDLKMPLLDGLGLLAWLKEHEEYQRMPKILMSASSEEREVDEAYRLGVNTFFQKPVSLNQFRELVYHLVGYWAHTERSVIRHPVA
jgi:Response regulator containing CheY-like receiver, AAA-type ATPase, and DNA-binding domains